MIYSLENVVPPLRAARAADESWKLEPLLERLGQASGTALNWTNWDGVGTTGMSIVQHWGKDSEGKAESWGRVLGKAQCRGLEC